MEEKKVSRRKFVAGAVGVAVLAAAGGAAYYYSQPSAPTATTTQMTSETTAATSAAGPQTIKIGCPGPLTGPAAVVFTDAATSLRLARDEVNAKGGLEVGGKKYMIETIVADDESNLEKGVAAITRLVTQDKVDFLVGGYHSALGLVEVDYVEQYKIPFLNEGMVSTQIRQKIKDNGYIYTFNVSPDANDQGWSDAEMMATVQKAKKVASVNENQPTGHDIVASAQAWLKANAPDVTWVEEQYYDIFGTNYDTEVSKALAAKPDVIYMETLGADSYILCDSLWNQGWRGEVLGNTGAFNTDEFLRTERDKIEGWCIDVSFSPKLAVTPNTLPYAEAFNALVGHLPNNHGAQCYDAAYILFDAIQRAGTFTDKQAVVNALQQTKFTGVRGKDMTFEPGTWQMHFKSLIVQIRNGEWLLVYPSAVAQGTYLPRAQLI